MKVMEKRKPSNNIQPYCQQMQILDNLKIEPVPDVALIPVQEEGYMDAPIPQRFRRRDSPWNQFQNCACEWITG
jgi:hypothetical protein